MGWDARSWWVTSAAIARNNILCKPAHAKSEAPIRKKKKKEKIEVKKSCLTKAHKDAESPA